MDVTTLMNLEDTSKFLPHILYGSISCGAGTWSTSLRQGEQVFSFDSRLRSEDSLHRTNYHRTNWSKFPSLDLLLIHENKMDKLHHRWMKDWGHPDRAKNILVVHGSTALTSFEGKWYKAWCKEIRGRQYRTHTWHVNAIHCGASMYSRYIVTFCYSSNISHLPPSSLPKDLNIRPCRNLIRTYGIRKTSYLPVSLMTPSSHPTHHNLVGTLYGQPVYQWDGPFWGEDARCWILVPELGIRRVQVDELEKLKGLTNSRYTNMSYNILLQSVELFCAEPSHHSSYHLQSLHHATIYPIQLPFVTP